MTVFKSLCADQSVYTNESVLKFLSLKMHTLRLLSAHTEKQLERVKTRASVISEKFLCQQISHSRLARLMSVDFEKILLLGVQTFELLKGT